MTTEEFVKAVNAVDNRDAIQAYVDAFGDAILQTFDEGEGFAIAILEKHSINWDIRTMSQITFPTKVLKLMTELVESREKGNKYVILNGEPSKKFWQVFLISDDGRLNSHRIDNPDDLDELLKYLYTKDKLYELTERLSPRMEKAIDTMIVTISEALEMSKNT